MCCRARKRHAVVVVITSNLSMIRMLPFLGGGLTDPVTVLHKSYTQQEQSYTSKNTPPNYAEQLST
jgi:hypothetical protein